MNNRTYLQAPRGIALALGISLLLANGSVLAEDTVPGNEPAMYLQLIQRMQEQGAWFASLAHIQAFRQQHGDTPALQLRHADALRQTGQPEQAADLYRKLLRGPTQAAAAHGLGLIAMEAGDTAQALLHLGNAAQLSPLRADYLGDLGYAHLLGGDYPAARAPLAQAAELSPADGRAIANLALWQLLSGNAAVAGQIMQQAKLPQNTQQAVLAKATQLRQRQAAPAPQASVPPPSPGAPTLLAAQQAPLAAARVQPPVSMLERFAPATTTSTEQGTTP